MSQHKLGMSSFGTQLAPGPSSASLAPQRGDAYSSDRSGNGSSFVMGGSPMGCGASAGQSRSREQRISSGSGRDEASSSKAGEHSEPRGPSVFRSIFGRRSEKILLGLLFYGLGLIVIGYVIVTMFGGSSDVEYYSRPPGFDDSVRPLWDR
jgi:hypothetical protein